MAEAAGAPLFYSNLLLLVRDGATTATSRTSVLTTRTQVPKVTQTTVDAHLLHTLEVVTQLSLHAVRKHLGVLAGSEVLLTVKEPVGNLELSRGLEDVDNALKLIRVQLTRTNSVSVQFFSQRVCRGRGERYCVQAMRTL